MAQMQAVKIAPSLWFDGKAREAAGFYISVFPNSRVITEFFLPTGPAEGAAIVEFELNGQRFSAVDGGPGVEYTMAVSFVINCESQGEVDHYWNALADGGETQICGWVKDKFGLSWQIVPSAALEELTRDPAKAPAVMDAMMQMHRIDISRLEEAHRNA